MFAVAVAAVAVGATAGDVIVVVGRMILGL